MSEIRAIDIEELGLTIQRAAIEIAISVDNLNVTLNKILQELRGDE
jgi:hypothetical protein|tara:strand:- start:14533 stop:14670 length:138 start_codon:yes stop_codon:yes gene_type:complete